MEQKIKDAMYYMGLTPASDKKVIGCLWAIRVLSVFSICLPMAYILSNLNSIELAPVLLHIGFFFVALNTLSFLETMTLKELRKRELFYSDSKD